MPSPRFEPPNKGWWRKLKAVDGLLKLRKMMRVSQRGMAEILEPWVGRCYTTATISIWEAAWKRKALPKGYWKERFMRRKTITAIHALIADLVTSSSGGKYTAKVKGVRKWSVSIKEVKRDKGA